LKIDVPRRPFSNCYSKAIKPIPSRASRRNMIVDKDAKISEPYHAQSFAGKTGGGGGGAGTAAEKAPRDGLFESALVCLNLDCT
jgi:hypothetical protein